MTTRRFTFFFLIALACLLWTCSHEGPEAPSTTPYNLVIPPFFPPMDIPADNPLTVEGIQLGRYLFWEKKLSGNDEMSCGTCHLPEHGFSDPRQYSVGINGDVGTRQAMPLINMGWSTSFFWDGREPTLEAQIADPIINPLEMDENWDRAIEQIDADPMYDALFYRAFGSTEVTKEKISKAIASFMRTMVSANSKFDKQRIGQYQFTPQELNGFNLFLTEGGNPDDVPGGSFGADCFHCHGFGSMQMTDYLFHNNGLDASFTDLGRGAVSGSAFDNGKFKTPTLRNVELTGPYMHDGRFNTLEEVIGHYNSGGVPSATIDPFMKFTTGGLQLSEQSKSDLIAFLKCLTDTSFIHNPAFSDPND